MIERLERGEANSPSMLEQFAPGVEIVSAKSGSSKILRRETPSPSRKESFRIGETVSQQPEIVVPNPTFAVFKKAISEYSGDPLAKSLLIEKQGPLSVYYAPFEWINPKARVVIVGISPGKTQAARALREAQQALLEGFDEGKALRCAQTSAAFSGVMRSNLISMLDAIGLHKWLGLVSSGQLFGDAAELLQATSILQFPTFIDGENYNGSPEPIKTPMLKRLIFEHFGKMCLRIPNAIFIPLGHVPADVLRVLMEEGIVSSSRVLYGLPHPSAANVERVKYFIGDKDRGSLSPKTNPDLIDEAKEMLIKKVLGLTPL
jgi:hypothetical protein